jgi:hypothetical protein
MIGCTIGIITFLSGLGLSLSESTRILGLIVIVIGIGIIWYAASRSRGTQGHNSDSGAGSGSDDGGPLRDVIVAPIENNIDYGPPCDPQCESVPSIQ